MIGTFEDRLTFNERELARERQKLAQAEQVLPLAIAKGRRVADLKAIIRETRHIIEQREGLTEIYGAAVRGELDAAGVIEAKLRLADRLVPAMARERTTV